MTKEELEELIKEAFTKCSGEGDVNSYINVKYKDKMFQLNRCSECKYSQTRCLIDLLAEYARQSLR